MMAQPRQRWEYRTAKIDMQGLYEDVSVQTVKWRPLDNLGADGWELVAVFNAVGEDATAIFKRPAH